MRGATGAENLTGRPSPEPEVDRRSEEGGGGGTGAVDIRRKDTDKLRFSVQGGREPVLRWAVGDST